MVVTCLPSAAESGVTHERTGFPSSHTVHAPHCAMPQPYLVPVNSRWSRRNQSSGVSGGTLTVTRRLFTESVVMRFSRSWGGYDSDYCTSSGDYRFAAAVCK